MRQYFVFMVMLGLLILIQQILYRETEQVNVSDDRPRRRTAKDHTLQFVSKEYKTGIYPMYQLAFSKVRLKLSLNAYVIKLGYLTGFDLMKEYFSFQCSAYNKKIPASFQHVPIDNSQHFVNKMIKKLSANKRKEAREIRTKWINACLLYGSQVTAISRTHAEEWNQLIDTWLTSQRLYSDQKGFDKRDQLLLYFLTQKDIFMIKTKILSLSRKQKKEIHCLSPPKVPTDYDIAYKPIYNHFSNIQSKLFDNTQYFMSMYLDRVLNYLSWIVVPSYRASYDPVLIAEPVTAIDNFKALEHSLQNLWEEIPKRTLPNYHLSSHWRFCLYLLNSVWEWFVGFLKDCLENENEEKKKQMSGGVFLSF